MYKPYEEEEKKKKQQQQTPQTNATNVPQTKTAPQQSTAPQYKPSNTVQTAQQNLATHTASKPTQYQSNWASQLDGLMSQIMNREKFSYDMNADALYQQAKDMYTNQANMGMQNAMAQASALTGGYGSSYGQMVGQQAYAQQMQGLNNMLPELYQNALNQYINEGNELYNRYNMVANQENLDYGRYRDSMNDYLAERDYLNSIYNTEAERDYNRYLDERNYTYQTDRDAIADSRYEQEWAASEEQRLHDNAYQDKLFDYNASRDEAADAQWREQFEYGKAQDALAQENWYKQFEYAQEQDRLAQENWNKQFEYGKEQDALAQKNWQDQFEYGKTQDALDNKYRDDAFTYQQEQDKLAQENWQSQFEYGKEQDALNNQYRQDAFDYQKEQDKQAQDNWQSQFDYGKEQDKQAQENWQAQFDASEEQRGIENERYDKALEDSKPTTKYEGEGEFNGKDVPKQIAGVPGLTTTNVGLFDENGYFKVAAPVRENEDGSSTYSIGGKEVTVKEGYSPYTNTMNPDAKNGVFGNGYQPDNVGLDSEGNPIKLSEVSGQFAVVNGEQVPVYRTDDGKAWVYDAANNEYFNPEGIEFPPSNTSNETPTTTDPTTTPQQETPPKETLEEEYPQEWYDDIDNTWEEKTNTAAVAGTIVDNPYNHTPHNEPTTATDNEGAYNDMLKMGWTDATNSPYSQAQRDKLISEGKMIAIEVNGEIKYLMR